MKPEDAEEYTQALGHVVTGSYKQIALAVRLGVPKALKLSVRDWVTERLGGYVRLAAKERQQAELELRIEGHSNREIAKILGVSYQTVNNDAQLIDKNLSRSTEEAADNAVSLEPTDKKLSGVVQWPIGSGLAPYYDQDGIVIYHGDARELVPHLPCGLMVTDPPYNVDYHYDSHDDALPKKDYEALLDSVLRPPLVLIHYPEAIFPIANRFGVPDEIVAWIYHANTPKQWRSIAWFWKTPDFTLDSQPYRNPTDKRIMRLLEDGREGARIYDWWYSEQVKNVSTEKTEHPCQIPLNVMLRILRITPFAGPVLDPFMGSGTTLVAAKQLGLQAIGVETSERYCEIAAERLQQRVLELVEVNE
jgi:site-specific DNA-methyltransferase (adenine-specific)